MGDPPVPGFCTAHHSAVNGSHRSMPSIIGLALTIALFNRPCGFSGSAAKRQAPPAAEAPGRNLNLENATLDRHARWHIDHIALPW